MSYFNKSASNSSLFFSISILFLLPFVIGLSLNYHRMAAGMYMSNFSEYITEAELENIDIRIVSKQANLVGYKCATAMAVSFASLIMIAFFSISKKTKAMQFRSLYYYSTLSTVATIGMSAFTYGGLFVSPGNAAYIGAPTFYLLFLFLIYISKAIIGFLNEKAEIFLIAHSTMPTPRIIKISVIMGLVLILLPILGFIVSLVCFLLLREKSDKPTNAEIPGYYRILAQFGMFVSIFNAAVGVYISANLP
jgi:hypothetical protein